MPDHAPFIILDHDLSSEDCSLLLGRLVKDVRRPLDSYLPARTSPLPFLSTYVLQAKLEPNTSINLSLLKSATTVTRLTVLLGLRVASEADSSTSFVLNSKLCRTVALEQHERVFAELMQRHKQDVHTALRQSGGMLYLVVGMKTAVEPRIVRADEGRRDVAVGAKIEVTVNGAGATGAEVENTHRKSYTAFLESTVDGERAFALQYCPVRLESKVRLARDGGLMGVKRVKKARLYGSGGSKALNGFLSFGPGDGSSGAEDGAEISLGSVLQVEGLDSLPF